MTEFQVRQDDIRKHRLVESTNTEPINDGQIRVQIKQFGLTANNITYAIVGDRMGYWQFFPPTGDDAQGWGVIPVWGFAEVVESKATEIERGERLFGYFLPATELIMTPAKVSETRFTENSDHRRQLPPAYNNYRRVSNDHDYNRDGDNEMMLLLPLFITSFCLWDFLKANDWYGAKQVIIVSASSKTSIGLSYALDEDSDSPSVVGLTSAGNLEFVTGLGTYDQVVSYDSLDQIRSDRDAVIVDMAGNANVLGELHSLLGDNMKFTSKVGLTHWDQSSSHPDIIADRTEIFFAPAHIQKRAVDWGPAGFDQRVNAFMATTAAKTRDWMQIRSFDRLTGIGEIYQDLCDGTVNPQQGLIVQP